MASSSDSEFTQAISEELLCPVCLEEFKEPKILACAHNVCKECLELMCERKSRKNIICPVCRQTTVIPDGGVTCLITNAVLVRLVEASLVKLKTGIRRSLENGRPVVELMTKKISDCDKVLNEIAANKNKVENEIHEKADELVEVIRKQETSLCSELDEFYGRQQSPIEREKTELDKLYSDASKSIKDAEEILKQTMSDATVVRTTAATITEQVEKITQLNLQESRDMSTSEVLEFTIDDKANYNKIFEDEKFGKLTKKILNDDHTFSDVDPSPTSSPPNMTSGKDFTGFDKDNGSALTELRLKRPNHSYSKGSPTAMTSSMSSYKGTVTTSCQAREMAAKRSEVLSEPSQSSSRTDKTTTDRYSKCSVCSNKATQCCKRCNIRSCIVCQNVVARLPCENGKEHLFVEESPRRMSGKEKDLGFRLQENNTCSFCDASSPSHKCIYCNKRSCGTCHIRYINDDCASNSSKRHYFVTQPPQNVTPKREDVKTSKEQTTPLAKNEVPQPDEENICDFCGLTAKLICKACLKTVCDTCLYVYKQDLCLATKKEHQFVNINAPSNEAADEDSNSSWNCERCTFLNSPSHRICAVCATSRGKQVEVLTAKSGSRKCGICTFDNEEGATVCKMCACIVEFDTPESYI